ncbi:MAG TPA: DNA polymerase III subunit gamma/tau [Firmicutes bacterium]|nr:DNA polymerase III subunit gamma/tau [Bacillota bacterium]
MSYKALYRKWRPEFFRDVVGQEVIVRTLRAQITSGHIAHAYLFTGPRGTGKTSMAKIFARAINCLEPEEGDACGKCEVCLALKGEAMDIIEMDAASNNGVDEIRALRENIVFPPAVGRYKVYIIDEVHMLSQGAFNALLKTLEEPPEHAVFILATTEVHKLPATILSRCQRFNFKSISVSDISGYLKKVLKASGAEFEPQAVDLIARSAEGGMRDALSIADMCLSYCGSNVGYEDVVSILGTADREFMFKCADALINSDVKGALDACAQLTDSGGDIGVFMRDIMSHLSDVLTAKLAGKEALTALPDDIVSRLLEQGERADADRLMRAIELLAQAESELKQHSRPKVILSAVMARICTPRLEEDALALRDRISVLEQELSSIKANGIEMSSRPAQPAKTEDKKEASSNSSKAPAAEKKISGAVKETKQDAQQGELWEALLARMRKNAMPVYMTLKSAEGGRRQDNAYIVMFSPEHESKMKFINGKTEAISKELEALTGEKLAVRTEQTVPAQKQEEQDELIANIIDIFGEENIHFKDSEE